MEALLLEYENKEALDQALSTLSNSNSKGVVVTALTREELQIIGRRRLIELKEKIDVDGFGDDDEITEEKIQAIIDEVRQKRYDEERIQRRN